MLEGQVLEFVDEHGSVVSSIEGCHFGDSNQALRMSKKIVVVELTHRLASSLNFDRLH
jgi:hypothetical protein